MKTSEFDKKFDSGKDDILEFLNISAARRLNKLNSLLTKPSSKGQAGACPCWWRLVW